MRHSVPADIERYVERAFAAGERPAVLELVANAVLHDGRPASPRLMRCALLSSGGSLSRLREQIAHLKIDYRDIIVEGEYLPGENGPVRVRDLNGPISET